MDPALADAGAASLILTIIDMTAKSYSQDVALVCAVNLRPLAVRIETKKQEQENEPQVFCGYTSHKCQ